MFKELFFVYRRKILVDLLRFKVPLVTILESILRMDFDNSEVSAANNTLEFLKLSIYVSIV